MTPNGREFALKLLPKGIAARAITILIAISVTGCTLAAGIVVFGVSRESERHQLVSAQDLDAYLTRITGEMLDTGQTRMLSSMVTHMQARAGMSRMAVYGQGGAVLSEAGGSESDAHAAQRAAIAAMGSGLMAHIRLSDGALAVADPITRGAHTVAAVAIVVKPDAFRFDLVRALIPFFVFAMCYILAVVPGIVFLVRRAVRPLNQLTAHAEQVARQGVSAPIELDATDEFVTLANAFNHMTARLDASMRRIQEIAFVDPVTQLPNADRFQREVDFFVLQAQSQNQLGAVLVFEIQRLPRMLQTLEPGAARDFLRVMAERVTHATNTVDRVVRVRKSGDRAAIAARLGASEFGVLAPDLSSASDVARFAQHLNAALNQPFEWRGHKLSLGAACGVAIAPRDGKDADSVIRHARMALQAALTSPSKLKVFTQSLDREAMARLTLEREMRGALERNEFRAFFQPKINLRSGRIEGAEALARWVRADRTIVSPGRFIPVAEESGLIQPLSEAIMREACWKAAAWARAGMPAKMAVNVSALQFRNERFADNVLQILSNSGLAPNQLELEITETVAMEDPDRALKLITPLRAAGVRFAIDDFGCGHSSLSALSKLPFDVIKIDQQFIRALERGDASAAAIIDMILALAKTLKLEVVAEGVERREHVQFMADRGCDWVQGFVYGAAVSPPDFSDLLRQQSGEEILTVDAA
jgi:EAL domain-containing protein (putative c-di-GMP-specific phosphodiesterase class I)/GGDEF domain-containing protein